MLAALLVDPVDHGRERGRLPAACRTGNEDEAPGLLGQLCRRLRHSELLEAHDLEGDRTKGTRDRAPLQEEVSPETGQAFDSEREVELAAFFEAVLLGIGEHRIAELFCIGSAERRHLYRQQVSVDPQLGRAACRDMEVGRSLLEHRLE
jgi:hypothetical protein